jgi:hypothetical protein
VPPNPAVEPLAVSFLNSFFWYELDISTNDMMADIFTKAVDKDTFLKFRMWMYNEPIKDRSRFGKAVQALAEALCKA